jgi:hypothetical protein
VIVCNVYKQIEKKWYWQEFQDLSKMLNYQQYHSEVCWRCHDLDVIDNQKQVVVINQIVENKSGPLPLFFIFFQLSNSKQDKAISFHCLPYAYLLVYR